MLVIVTTDWLLEDANGRTYGMCFVKFSPPYAHMNIKRGFSLHSPTHQRCALFALILGLEAVDKIANQKNNEVVISTKHRVVHDMLFKGRVDAWLRTNRWPNGMIHLRNLLLRTRDLISDLPDNCTVVCIARDGDDPSRTNLVTREKDLDVENILKEGGGKAEMEKRMIDARMRNVLVQELMQSGARASRRHAVPPEKKKMTLAKKEKANVTGNAERGSRRSSRTDHGAAQGPGVGAQVPKLDPLGGEQRPEARVGSGEVGDGRQDVPAEGNVQRPDKDSGAAEGDTSKKDGRQDGA